MASIIGLGEFVPQRVRNNSYWNASFTERFHQRHIALADFQVKDDDPVVLKYSAPEVNDPFMGAETRRVVDDDVSAPMAEAYAGMSALLDASVSASQVDVVLSSAVLPEFYSATGSKVAHIVGATNAWSMGYDVACASGVVGIKLASALVDSGTAKYVLLTQSSFFTRLFPREHLLSPSVGDGVTAMLFSKSNHGLAVREVHAITHGEYSDAVVIRRAKDEPNSPWYAAGGRMSMGTNDPNNAKILVRDTIRIAAKTVQELGDKTHLDLTHDVDVLCSVQLRNWTGAAIAESVGIDPKRVVHTFPWRAHLGPVGPIANLIQARKYNLLRSGSKVVLYAQGAGLTRAAALVEQQ